MIFDGENGRYGDIVAKQGTSASIFINHEHAGCTLC